MATSFRLPEDLKREATAYAFRCGVSLNAVLKIALRTYLDAQAASPQPRGETPAVTSGRVETSLKVRPNGKRQKRRR